MIPFPIGVRRIMMRIYHPQMVQFGVVGSINALVDLFVFNALMKIFPTRVALGVIAYNTLGFAVANLQSYGLNRMWTFRQQRSGRFTWREVSRFVAITLVSLIVSNLVLLTLQIWLPVKTPMNSSATWLLNAQKLAAGLFGAICNYLGYRWFVFAKDRESHQSQPTDLSENVTAMNVSPPRLEQQV